VTDARHCEQILAATLAEWGRLDILFNNAGIVPRGNIEETDEAEWDRAFEVNVKAIYRLTRLVIPIMRRQGGGVIVNNASDWGIVGGPRHTAYSATKGAVVLMTKSLALDYARENIRVNAICPGDTFVERWRTDQRDPSRDLADELRAMGEALPIGRLGTVEEIAKAVLFLACDDSSFMTGATLIVDGGNTTG
jgi:NAD(P)-dependent dehydrogenase (short-subunit alcohol dehydrogenase family)